MKQNALFLGTSEDKDSLPYLRGMFNGIDTYFHLAPMSMLSELEIHCKRHLVTRVVSTSIPILQKLLARMGNNKDNPSLSDYAGSLFEYNGIEIVFVPPLSQLFTVPYGKFIAARYISKVVAQESWPEATPFKWALLTPTNIQEAYENLSQAFAIACDIETFRHNLAIRCTGYTGIYIGSDGNISTKSYVLPLIDDFSLAWTRKINDLPNAKIFQNGKYDNAYNIRFNCVPRNWLWDTQYLFHSYYSELPKDLAFLNAFFLRKVVYWKDLAETNDLHEYYRYNALDTWATANVWIQQILQLPEWAKRNYLLEFPLEFPCLLAELTGVKRSEERLAAARAECIAEETKELTSLRNCLGSPDFNPGSPPQVKKLLKVLGCGDVPSSGEDDLNKYAFLHPLNAFLLGKILTIRGLRKLRTTYLRTDDDITKTSKQGTKDYRGRIFYSLNPHATDTARLGSRESAFWCGFNIQNIPRGPEVKQTIESESDFFIAECDLEQAESRDTGYISGDITLIQNVSGERDFHSINASAFFGVPYASIYDQDKRKVIDKPLRNLGKPVNHGANYNMGPGVLVTSMTLPYIYKSKEVLKLPFSNPIEIAECLLTIFHKTYPGLKGVTAFKSAAVRKYFGYAEQPEYKLYAPGTYYADTAMEVRTTSMLVSRAFHHTPYNLEKVARYPEEIHRYIDEEGDWARYCFGKPWENKMDLNALVAHRPQSLNSRTLNEAWMQVFYLVALPNPTTFRLNAQIHDSILFQYAKGSEHHIESVRKLMEIPVTVKDIHGTFRTFTVPAAAKFGTEEKKAKYWSETE